MKATTLLLVTVVYCTLIVDICSARPHRNRHHRRHNRERGPAGRVDGTSSGPRHRGPGGGNEVMPTPATDSMNITQIMNYLERYRYMGRDAPDPQIADLMETNMSMAVTEGTRLFQKRYFRYGLQETGVLDEATVNLMQKPRCGNADMLSMADMMKRKKRYAIAGGKWRRNNLTYKISQYSYDYDLTWDQIDSEIHRAFQVWEEVTPLRFEKIGYTDPRVADIDIRFVAPYQDHGDGRGNAFDGPGGVLAHAFFPIEGLDLAGDTHFDDYETFTINSHEGFNLFTVAAHEFGHALGLGHSTDPSALMAPFYSGYKRDFVLPLDDVMGIQALYGGPMRPMEPSSTISPSPGVTDSPTDSATDSATDSPTDSPTDNICEDSSFDAITTVLEAGQYKTYGFKGRHYFLIDPRLGGIAESYPRLISQGWPGLPDHIDAALFEDAGDEWRWNAEEQKQERFPHPKTYVFKGYQYWEVTDMGVSSGPLPISDWGLTTPIDAAFVWRKNGKIYFFKGSQYYRYTRGRGMDEGYPRDISVWGLPNHIDAAMQYTNSQSYFFKGNQFWAYDDHAVAVESGYPRDSYGYWFRC